MSIRTVLVCALGSLLCFLWLFWEMPRWVCAHMILFWAVACTLDITYTAKNQRFVRQYEQSFILCYLARRYPPTVAIAGTLCVECMLVLGAPFIITREWDLPLFAILCLLVGMIHISGFVESRQFMTRKKPTFEDTF